MRSGLIHEIVETGCNFIVRVIFNTAFSSITMAVRRPWCPKVQTGLIWSPLTGWFRRV